MHPPSFKDNSKGHIRTKYTGMTCNGVGVILPRRWWTLGSCRCAKQQMCRWSVYFILIVLLIEIIMIWTTPLMFLRNLSIFCLRRATFFFIALMHEVEKNAALLSKRQTSFNVKYFWEYLHTPMDEQWDIVCQAYVKNRTVCRMMSRRIEFVG